MNATELSHELARHAEAVCRHYLPRGTRQGRYWICGDVRGAAGRSLHVRLAPPGKPGNWTDEATGQHGDLLDLIREATRASELRDAMVEARRFLSLPIGPGPAMRDRTRGPPRDTRKSALAIWRRCQPIRDTHADAYLRARGIPYCDYPALRFHPTLYRRDGNRLIRLPALVAAVLDQAGALTGIHRTWLDPREPRKAALQRPRKALGDLRTHAVRFNRPRPGGTLIAGEGIETVLSVVTAIPGIAAAATLSAAHLSAFEPPPDLGLLIVASDAEEDGRLAAQRLARRCRESLCPAHVVLPVHGDFNDDLRNLGAHAVADAIGPLIAAHNRDRHPTGIHRDTIARVERNETQQPDFFDLP